MITDLGSCALTTILRLGSHIAAVPLFKCCFSLSRFQRQVLSVALASLSRAELRGFDEQLRVVTDLRTIMLMRGNTCIRTLTGIVSI